MSAAPIETVRVQPGSDLPDLGMKDSLDAVDDREPPYLDDDRIDTDRGDVAA